MFKSNSDQLCVRDSFSPTSAVFQTVGQALALLIPFIIIYNEYATLKTLDPFYRITLPALCFLFALITTSINIKVGIIGSIFALPLIPHLAIQIAGFLGYARVAHFHNPGLALIAGLYCGAIIHHLIHRKKLVSPFALPWQAGLVMIFLTVSVALSIAKNLYQSSSDFHLSTLLYNLMNMRTIDWHDDYRPLVDWIAFGAAFTLLAIFVPALKAMPDRNHVVFKPLIWGLIIAAVVGYWQSKIGIGLTKGQLMFRSDVMGYMAIGFQPDNHAFAGHMLLGTIGIIGYLYYTQSKYYRTWMLLLVMPLAWISLFLSKSRSSFAISIIFLGVILLIWLFRHWRYLRKTIFVLGAVLFVTLFSALLFKDASLYSLTVIAQKLGFADLAALNLALVYRPEIFAAAIKIFTMFPLLGIGLGEFYRQASNHELTNSYYLSIEQNGENAHNYFLQILAENGLIGFLLFALMVFYPLWKAKNIKPLIPALIALGAIFASNLYGHSMLVRENLFLATVFIALMYAWLTPDNIKSSSPLYGLKFNKNKSSIVLTAGIVIVLFFTINETIQTFRRFPFSIDTQCFKSKKIQPDGWTSGIVEMPLPAAAIGMNFKVTAMQPAQMKTPLSATLSLSRSGGELISSKPLAFDPRGNNTFGISLPENHVINNADRYLVTLRLNHCFIPRNLGNTPDGRRLGVKLEEINYLHR
jgi:O-antigen ligase